MLSDKIEDYKAAGKFPAVTPAKYKKDYPYLREVDSLALANKQLDLQAAFRNCFSKSRKKNVGFPKFESAKHSRRSYTTNNQKGIIAIVDGGFIRLPKAGKIKAFIHRMPGDNWLIKSATVFQESDGKYYVSVLFEFEIPVNTYTADKTNAIGLDYASDSLYVDRIHRYITNQRLDNLHKISTGIANRYDVVCVESLNMRAMANKGFGNGKAALDNGYGMFLSMLNTSLPTETSISSRLINGFLPRRSVTAAVPFIRK